VTTADQSGWRNCCRHHATHDRRDRTANRHRVIRFVVACLIAAGLLAECSGARCATPADVSTTDAVDTSLTVATTCTAHHGQQSGIVAPCTGVLVPPADYGALINCREVDLPGARGDVDECRSSAAADAHAAEARITEAQTRAAIATKRAEDIAAILDGIAHPVPPAPPVWERPWLVGGLAAGGAVAVTAGIAAATTDDRAWLYAAAGGLVVDAVLVGVAAIVDATE